MRDLLIEMAVRELSTQCKFADTAYSNILKKAPERLEVSFSSIHSFLSHCAMVSKLLWSKHLKSNIRNQTITQILEIMDTSKIRGRRFRNILEHYDEYLKKWIEEKGDNVNIFDFNVGSREAIRVGNGVNTIFVRHFDPATSTFTLIGKDLNLAELHNEVLVIKSKADNWLKNNTPWSGG